MDLHKIRCFVTVAEELHFGRAARRLYVTPSAVSVAVRTLEGQLGLVLFERTSRRVELTQAGRVLLVEASDLLARHESMQAAVRRERARQTRRVAFTVGLHDEGLGAATAPVLRGLRSRLPDVDLEVRALDYTQLGEAVGSGAVDVVLGATHLATDDDETVVVHRDPVLLQVSSDHALASAPVLTMDDVLDLPFARPPTVKGTSRVAAPYYLAYRRNGERPRLVGEEFHNITELLNMTAATGAVLAVNAGSARQFSHPQVRFVPLVDAVPIGIGATFRARRRSRPREVLEALLADAAGRNGLDAATLRDDPGG